MARKQRDWRRDLGWSLILTPPVMLFPLTLGPFIEPLLVLEAWDLYLLFFGLPWAAGIPLLLWAGKRPLEPKK